MIRRILVLALLAALALPLAARADMILFDDPAQSSHPRILNVTAQTTTQSSITFTRSGGTPNCVILVAVTACSTCNITPTIVVPDPTGQSINVRALSAAAQITTTGNYSYRIGPGTSTNSFYTTNTDATCPPIFQFQMVESGVSATYTVSGFAY